MPKLVVPKLGEFWLVGTPGFSFQTDARCADEEYKVCVLAYDAAGSVFTVEDLAEEAEGPELDVTRERLPVSTAEIVCL